MRLFLLPFSFVLLTVDSFALYRGGARPVRRTTQISGEEMRRIGCIGGSVATCSFLSTILNGDCHDDNDHDDGNNTTNNDNNNYKIEVFDSRYIENDDDDDGTGSITGGGIQLNGGAAVLKRVLTRSNWDEFRTRASRLQGVWARRGLYDDEEDGDIDGEGVRNVLRLNIRDLFTKADEARELVDDDGEVHAFTVMRATLTSLLIRNVRSLVTTTTDDNIISFKGGVEITSIDSTSDGLYFLLDSDSNKHGPYDLIVGGDGVNSVAKRHVNEAIPILGDFIGGKIYSGIRIAYAVARNGRESKPHSTTGDADAKSVLCQFFGRGGYALTGTYGNYDMCALIWGEGSGGKNNNSKNSESTSDDENASWDASSKTGEGFLNICKEKRIPTELGVERIAKAGEKFFELGVYFHLPFSPWFRGRVVLVGDACHAMPPFLGQGANQALQDGYRLGKVLRRYNEGRSGEDTFEELVRNEYVRKRRGKTTLITLKSIFIGYLECGYTPALARFRDAFFYVAGKTGIAATVFLGGGVQATKQKEEEDKARKKR